MVIAFVPCSDWNPEPSTVTWVPTGPVAGEMLVTCGGGTLKYTFALLAMPPAFTVTGPVVAAAGTAAVMLVSDQPVTVAGRLLKRTVPVVAVKLAPVIVTDAPAPPVEGVTPLTIGATVKLMPLLCRPP